MGNVAIVGLYGMSALFQMRQLPREGETCPADGLEFEFGGKGYNQALAAARMGAEVFFAAAVGKDAYGQQAKICLEESELQHYWLFEDEQNITPFAAILTDNQGRNTVTVCQGASRAMRPEQVMQLEGIFSKSQILLTQLEIPLPVVEKLLEIAKKYGMMTIVDTAPACEISREMAEKMDIITPNYGEALVLAGAEENLQPEQICEKLRQRGFRNIIITMGEEGAFLALENGETYLQKAFSCTCVNSTGAGDTFSGTLAASLSRGMSLSESVRYGTAASALAVSRPGVCQAIPTWQEVCAFLQGK